MTAFNDGALLCYNGIDNNQDSGESGDTVAVVAVQSPKTDSPKNALLVMHNDDYTTTNFVVEVLVEVLGHDIMTATALMLEIHHNGRAVVANLPLKLAKQKQSQITKLAQFEEFPLLVTVENW